MKKHYNQLTDKDRHDGCEIRDLTDLRNVYKKVEIADGDEVLFGEGNIPLCK